MTMKNTVSIVIGIVVLLGGAYFIAGGQSDEVNGRDNETLAITTSFYPLAFALERIVGDLGTVTNIGAGRDPHSFEPSVQDMVVLQRSDVVVLQGADFEPWGDDVAARLEADTIPTILVTAGIELHEGGHEHHDEEHHAEDEVHEADEHNETADGSHDSEKDSEPHTDEHAENSDHEHGAYDPHTWLDPVLFSETVEYLATEIAALDPDNAEVYIENARALQTELLALDDEYANRLAACSLDEVITSHDAFGYVADRYGFEVHAIAGLSTQDTPSATTLAQLRAEAQEGIGAILLEENSITAYGETLARETGLQTLSLNPIAYMIPSNETYFTLMQQNLNSLSTALACNE